jgi:hypothetical protein
MIMKDIITGNCLVKLCIPFIFIRQNVLERKTSGFDWWKNLWNELETHSRAIKGDVVTEIQQ